MDLNNFLILEKRISQISANVEVIFAFDIIKTSHAEDRSDFSKRGLSGDNQNHISNGEMSEFVSFFKTEISEDIAKGNIVNQTEFVIKSIDRSMAMAIVAEESSKTIWKLIIKTVFRESEDNEFNTKEGQLVYYK